jgi:hypothetical protein
MNDRSALQQDAEHIYHEWDKALSNNDVEALMALYTIDATIESPLIPHLMRTERGVCTGQKEIRNFLEEVAKRKPTVRKYYRKGFFTDGKTLMWEYPRESPSGDQMDFVEVMEIKGGLIWHHRVYWGWMGFKVMQGNAYHR